MKSFEQLNIQTALKDVLREIGLTTLTPIQKESIPLLLAGHDLIGKSKTGSGKTIAFALPALEQIKLDDKGRVTDRGISTLVLCPTRELCAQVTKEIRKLGRKHLGLRVLPVAGGALMREQIDALQGGVQVVVGTPGRVLDHLKRRTIDLRKLKTLVLDEADRMLEMGFQEEMEQILEALPLERQTVLFSATFPIEIDSLSHQYQKDAITVSVDSVDTAPPIHASYLTTSREQKLDSLVWALHHEQPGSSIVFCNMKITVDEVDRYLKHKNFDSIALHGDLEQSDRDRVMVKFRNGSARILVATDVAARGIDVASLDLVVNYDIPKQTEIYVHRIGRTGRAGETGRAITIALNEEKVKIESIAKETATEIVHEEMLPMEEHLPLKAHMSTLYISGGKKDKMRAGDILGALTGEGGGLSGDEVGKIDIFERFSFVAVAKPVANRALKELQAGKIKGKRYRIEPVR